MLMATEQGNMGAVLLAWAETAKDAIKRSDADALAHPLNAQIRPNCTPRWYVVVVVPGCENRASGHLIGRRFGVFDPFGQVKVVQRGRVRIKTERLLPGYLLVFAWDIEQQQRRVRACPGVLDILRKGDGTAAVVPDELIDYLQGKEISRSSDVLELAHSLGIDPATPIPVMRDKAARSKKWSKKLKKNKKKQKNQRGYDAAPVAVPRPSPVEIATIRSYSALEGIDELAAPERISLFHRAIGLGSQHLPNGHKLPDGS